MKLILATLSLVSLVTCRSNVNPPDTPHSTGAEPFLISLPDQLPTPKGPKSDQLSNADISTEEKGESVHRNKKDCESLGGQCVKKGNACPDQLSVESSLCTKSQRCCHPAPQTCPVVTCEPCLTTTIEATTKAAITQSTATTQATTTLSPVIEECGSKGGHVIGNECVIFSGGGDVDKISWQSALETCWKKYGSLTSPAHPEALLEFVQHNHAGIPFWVGGYSLPYEKTFTWLNNTEVPLNSKDFPWAPHEPSPPDHPSDQRCMVVNYGGGYANLKCSNHHQYACTLDACGLLGGVSLGHQCLKFKLDPLTWENATDACTSDGGKLVSPAYPQTLLDYISREYNTSENIRFWVGGLKTDFSQEDSWYWLRGEHIPLGDNFPWASGEPNNHGGIENCLEVVDWANADRGYNNAECITKINYICEYETELTQPPAPVPFVMTHISTGKYIGPNNVFPYIKNNAKLTLHTILDINMHMTFDIIDDIWGYIRHIESGKILQPSSETMVPEEGTIVVLDDDRRPWALFALDQYQNRIMHISGKYIKPKGELLTISSDESDNKTMDFLFINITNPGIEVLPYGYPVVSGDWQLVFSVLDPIATHTYSATVAVGRSSTRSTSAAFKFGFESTTKIGVTAKIGFFGRGVEATAEQTFKVSLSTELQLASSATWQTENKKAISFTVEAGVSVAIWQRAYIMEQGENKAVYVSDHFADTNSSRINPNNFNGSKRRYI